MIVKLFRVTPIHTQVIEIQEKNYVLVVVVVQWSEVNVLISAAACKFNNGQTHSIR